MEPRDALADDMDALVGVQPPLAVELAVGAVVQRTDVVGESVEPDVGDLGRIVRDRDTPSMSALDATGDADVVEAPTEEREGLDTKRLRRDPKLVRLDQLEQLLGVVGEPEEPVRLGNGLGEGVVFRAAPVDEIGRVVELFATDAVRPGVVAPVEIAATLRMLATTVRRRGDDGDRDWCE